VDRADLAHAARARGDQPCTRSGLGFGTGSHPSTRLCLQWLERSIAGGETVLDYGCGSGILAIAALKLGARRAVGVDIDPDAVATARTTPGATGLPANSSKVARR